MPISFTCTCGRKFRTPDENAGRTATCPDCRTKLVVPAASSAAAPALPPPLPEDDLPAPEDTGYGVQSEEVVPVPRRPVPAPPAGRPRRDDPYDRDDDYPSRRPSYARDDIRARIVKRPSRSGGGMTSGGVVGGIAMMAGAVVWFFGGLAFGIIFFYPPFLFVIGLIAFIKGLASGR